MLAAAFVRIVGYVRPMAVAALARVRETTKRLNGGDAPQRRQRSVSAGTDEPADGGERLARRSCGHRRIGGLTARSRRRKSSVPARGSIVGPGGQLHVTAPPSACKPFSSKPVGRDTFDLAANPVRGAEKAQRGLHQAARQRSRRGRILALERGGRRAVGTVKGGQRWARLNGTWSKSAPNVQDAAMYNVGWLKQGGLEKASCARSDGSTYALPTGQDPDSGGESLERKAAESAGNGERLPLPREAVRRPRRKQPARVVHRHEE